MEVSGSEECGQLRVKKEKLFRCLEWLQTQNGLEPKKLAQQNKNDIQFIIQSNADRNKFLYSTADDDTTVPAGVGEPSAKPVKVPLKLLRVDQLSIECAWQSCWWLFNDYELFQKHVKEHIPNVHVVGSTQENVEYMCLWDACGHKATDFNEMVRHINYHAYHGYLLAIGFNGRATLNLERCNKDSTRRNQLPLLPSEHACIWTGCQEKFNAIQAFFDHVKLHIRYSENFLCSWGGCGATFPRRVLLTMHVRSHTGERLIACYHCGHHFATNVKLANHLRRQNVNPNAAYHCSVCGVSCATEYLGREHARQHVSAYACSLCDMSATSPASLAQHVRFRHLEPDHVRIHCCPHCSYRAVTKCDLRRHIATHDNKMKRKAEADPEAIISEENADRPKKKKSLKKYACHLCHSKEMKVFSRGSRLTTHLVKVHGAQWPFGHSRFRYQISKDGMYRLTTTRYEILEVSKKIVDGHSGPKELQTNSFEYDLKEVSEPTECTPRHFEIVLKGTKQEETACDRKRKEKTDFIPEEKKENNDKVSDTAVEITMCDVDEHGNVISSEILKSVLYS